MSNYLIKKFVKNNQKMILSIYIEFIIIDIYEQIKVVIFDFDGTIADTLPFSFQKFLEIAKTTPNR